MKTLSELKLECNQAYMALEHKKYRELNAQLANRERALNRLIFNFNQLNIDAALLHESVLPLTANNVDYYDQQCQNLEINEVLANDFLNWLKSQ
jgi:hypothetical protein